MNCYKNLHIPFTFKIILLLSILQFLRIDAIAQSNSVKISALNFLYGNTDLGYERTLKNKISVGANLQFWFLDEEKRSQAYGVQSYSHIVNRGMRGSMEIRKYFFEKALKNKSSDFNVGFSIHFGRHYMKDAKSSVSTFNLNGNWLNITSSNNSSPANLITKYDTKVFSGGMGFHLDYRLLFKDGFLFKL